MFKKGKKAQQKSLNDFDMNLSEALKKSLENSWANNFFEDVYLSIDEEKFKVLYSEEYSRPNAAVNKVISLLILKEINNVTDEELIESMHFDKRYHYALGIEDIEKERVCINTITNFRSRIVRYEKKTGRNLLEEEIKSLTYKMIDKYKVETKYSRMDSLMISNNCKMLTRIDLAYTLIKSAVKSIEKIEKIEKNILPEEYKQFLENNYEKEILYRTTKAEAPTKLIKLAEKAYKLNEIIKTINNTEEESFVNLKRFVEEQCIVNEKEEIEIIEGKEVKSNYIQTGTDPESTYRSKNGKGYIGYVGNIVECRDKEKELSMIVDFDIAQNIKSDVSFAEELLERQEITEKLDTISVDGGYYGESIVIKAEAKNIKMNFSKMTGTSPEKEKLYAHEYKFDTEKCVCPKGIESISIKINEENNKKTAYFLKPDCKNCELKTACIGSEGKDYNIVNVTQKKYCADKTRSKMGTEEHTELSNFRAGVEGVQSVLRRRHKVDKIPAFGLAYKKIWFSTKIMAFNLRQLSRYLLNLFCISIFRFSYPQNIKYVLFSIVYFEFFYI